MSYFLLWQSVQGVTPPQLDTNPVNVQDLRENVKLTFTCTFGTNFFLREIVIMQGNVRQTTILSLDPQRQIPIKGLEQASTKLNLLNIEYTVEIVTTRAINNLTFSCVGGIVNGSELTRFPSTSESLNIKCRDCCNFDKINFFGDRGYVVQMVQGRMRLMSLLGVLM